MKKFIVSLSVIFSLSACNRIVYKDAALVTKHDYKSLNGKQISFITVVDVHIEKDTTNTKKEYYSTKKVHTFIKGDSVYVVTHYVLKTITRQ